MALYLGPFCAGDQPPMATPFEEWCHEQEISPETPGAWEVFEARELAGRVDVAIAG